jgi:hypothetical protein
MLGCHPPRKRGIQYPAASRLDLCRLWNTGSPGRSRAMTPGCPAGRPHPTGKSRRHRSPSNCGVSSPFRKNISVFPKCKSGYMIRHPVPERGALAIVTNVGAGSGGRGSAGAQVGSQGGFYRSVSGHNARRRTALQRTAKSCGPGASAVGVKSRGGFASPTGRTKPYSRGDGVKQARSPGRARYKR